MIEDLFDDAISLLTEKKKAFEFTFNDSVHAEIVLKDLAKFCRADKSTFHSDPRIHAVLEGRREVWLRIQKYLNLTPEEILDLTRKE